MRNKNNKKTAKSTISIFTELQLKRKKEGMKNQSLQEKELQLRQKITTDQEKKNQNKNKSKRLLQQERNKEEKTGQK